MSARRPCRQRSLAAPVVLALLFGSLLSLVALPARADANGIAVRAPGCPAAHAAEIERLLAIDFHKVTEGRPEGEPLRVELDCEPGGVLHITAVDPITGKRLEREVELGPARAGTDRTIALLTSQLFLVSWAELLLAPPESPEPLPVPLHSDPVADRGVAERMTREAFTPPTRRWDAELVAGARARELYLPVVFGFIDARPGLVLGRHLRLFLDLGYERGAAARASGSVGFSIASAGLGAAWRSSRLGILSFDFGGTLAAAYVDVRGEQASAAFVSSSAHGAVAQVTLGGGPMLALDLLHVGLELQGGATFPRASARVAGDRDASIAGVWTGLAIVLGVAEADR